MTKLKLIPSYDQFKADVDAKAINEGKRTVERNQNTGDKYVFVAMKTADGAFATLKVKYIEHDPNAANVIYTLLGIIKQPNSPIDENFQKPFNETDKYFIAYEQVKKDVPEVGGLTGRIINVFILSVLDKTKFKPFPEEYYYDSAKSTTAAPIPFHVWLVPAAELPKYALTDANRLVADFQEAKNKSEQQLDASLGKVGGKSSGTNRIEFKTPKGTNAFYIPA